MIPPPDVSDRVRRFLAARGSRGPALGEAAIRGAARLEIGGRVEPAPPELVEAMVRFERRYGGLRYRVVGGNAHDYGLDGDATGFRGALGTAFAGIVDGDWTWVVDLLADGSTSMGPGAWPDRVIDRSVAQRLEKHALLVEVRDRPHRAFQIRTPPHGLEVDAARMPLPAVPEATGPADRWWSDASAAVEISLSCWPPGEDTWRVRCFADDPLPLVAAVRAAVGGGTVVPEEWCELDSRSLAPDEVCRA